MKPLSIIIPVYKTEQFIERCLVSVLEQTLDNFEIVIIDDCSPDNAIQIAEKVLIQYPNRKNNTKIIRLPQNKGLANARKIAFSHATGKYITCLDSDDYLEKRALEEMLDKAHSTDACIVICDYFVNYPNKERLIHQTFSETQPISALLNGQLHSSYCNKLYKKEILDKITILDSVNMCEDLLAMLQMFTLSKKIVYLDKAFLHYVQYNQNSYTNQMTNKSCKDIITVMDFISNYLKKQKIKEDYHISLAKRKLFSKHVILTSVPRKERATYLELYQEENNYLAQMPIYPQFILRASNANLLFLIDIILMIKKTIK